MLRNTSSGALPTAFRPRGPFSSQSGDGEGSPCRDSGLHWITAYSGMHTLYTVSASPAHSPSLHPVTYVNAEAVVREFHEALARSSDMAVAVAAITALTSVIRSSSASTVMGLEKELKDAANALQRWGSWGVNMRAFDLRATCHASQSPEWVHVLTRSCP